jgi:hypothetical protein
MSQVLLAVVPHRRLMELKNSGVVKAQSLKDLADVEFLELRDLIISRRLGKEKRTGLMRLVSKKSYEHHMSRDVEIMFDTRESLVEHIRSVQLPTPLVPVSPEEAAKILFLDRAAKYSAEAEKVVGLFKLHDEVIVDADTSFVLSWVLNNTQRLKEALNGEESKDAE